MTFKAKKQILIVDDDEDINLALQKILQSAGFEAKQASSVETALTLLTDLTPSLIITDLLFPDDHFSGFHLLERIRMLRAIKGFNLPVIVLSAASNRDSVTRSMALGACDYVTKPLKAKVVIQKVRKALRNSEALLYCFPKEKMPNVNVEFQASISRAGEIGFILDGPVKLGYHAQVRVRSGCLRHLRMEERTMRMVKHHIHPALPSQYQNQISVTGLSSEAIQNIRKATGEWK